MQDYDIQGQYSLFWDGPYSQWYPSRFTFGNKTFNCCEQFMMYFKALVHDDLETARLIMKETSPKAQKALGRKVKNFSEQKWSKAVSMAVVYIGNYCKFSQDNKLKEYLLNDPGKIMVEASPYDKVWGIGRAASDKLAWNKLTWLGENRLGDCITGVKIYLEGNSLVPYHEAALKTVMEILNKHGRK